MPEDIPRPKPSRTALDLACEYMADAHLAIKERCDEFEMLLDVPEINLAEVRKAQAAVRSVGVRSIGLTTSYLAELNSYMKLLEK